MTFFATLGYKLPLGSGVHPGGSLILASAMPMHQLVRRRLGLAGDHLEHRLFDPQLYLAGMDAVHCGKHCTNLASYPWFGIAGVEPYDSGEYSQASWRQATEDAIEDAWPSQAPSGVAAIRRGTSEGVAFQHALGTWAVILPAPLIIDPSSTCDLEELWLDHGLRAAADAGKVRVPVFATVAISDVCLRMKPENNPLLDLIVDMVTAREGLDGVYLVIEQAGEPAEGRNCEGVRTLASLLHLVHAFSVEAGLRVGVNFIGPYGLVCQAAGAEWWASNWYLSLRRLRVADRVAGGRAYPSYWSTPAAVDIHLDSELDALASAGLFDGAADRTLAAKGLNAAVLAGKAVSEVPAWTYRQSNVQASMDHYLQACIAWDARIEAMSQPERLEHVDQWLQGAVELVGPIEVALGKRRRTRTSHVRAWLESLEYYRDVHAL